MSKIASSKTVLRYNSQGELIFVDVHMPNPDGTETIFSRSTAKGDYAGGTDRTDIDSGKDWVFDANVVVT
jgi:hypothetical protein